MYHLYMWCMFGVCGVYVECVCIWYMCGGLVIVCYIYVECGNTV